MEIIILCSSEKYGGPEANLQKEIRRVEWKIPGAKKATVEHRESWGRQNNNRYNG